MRIYGRKVVGHEADGRPIKEWVKVETDANGQNDMVYLTNLAQVLYLSINESPFFADWGIPARDSVMQQVNPDLYVGLTQQRFASRFAILLVAKRATFEPMYDIAVTTNYGVRLNTSIPVPV